MANRAARRPRVAFFTLSALGNRTWAANLQKGFSTVEDFEQLWVETDMWRPGGIPERLPAPYLVRNTMRAWLDVREATGLFEPDVLVFNPPAVAGLCQWNMLRTPTVLCLDATPTELDRMAHGYGGSNSTGAAARVRHLATRANFRLARRIVPWSQSQAASLVDDYAVAESRIRPIPPPVDTSYWKPGPAHGGDTTRLLFVGGDFTRKGGDILLAAFGRLAETFDIELDIVSGAAGIPCVPRVRVHSGLAPDSPELLRLYQQADIFVLPTRADFSPLVVPEAMACGLPVVATTVGAIPELVEHGISGVLVPPGDADALGQALASLIADASRRQSMGGAARRRAIENYATGVVAGQFAAVLDEVLRRKRATATASGKRALTPGP